ncbi:hypothetical protein [Microcoleus sp. B13-B6]|uniref:hypothetical protein n=1 Tax=Microcoleus sp. B13-B6 TaxID=2818652 RepID=UPI002FD17263
MSDAPYRYTLARSDKTEVIIGNWESARAGHGPAQGMGPRRATDNCQLTTDNRQLTTDSNAVGFLLKFVNC